MQPLPGAGGTCRIGGGGSTVDNKEAAVTYSGGFTLDAARDGEDGSYLGFTVDEVNEADSPGSVRVLRVVLP